MRAQLTNHDYEQLSAYIDGQLAPGDQRRLEERLRALPEMQEALEDLQRTRTLLRSIPHRRAPRNFTLTPAMVGAQGKRRGWGGFSLNMFPALSFASAIATLALISSIVLGLLPGAAPATSASQPGAAPAAELPAAEARQAQDNSAMKAAEPTQAAVAPSIAQNAPPAAESAPAGLQANPPVITWSDPNVYGLGGVGSGFAYGRGGGGGGSGMDPAASVYEQYGLGKQPGESIVIPQGSVDSLNGAQEEPRAASPAAGSESAVTGNGPILGVPQPGETGRVLQQGGDMGLSGQAADAPDAQPAAAEPEAVPAAQPPRQQPGLFGLPQLAVLQILLALIAIGTGLAAWLVRRKS